MKIQILGTGCPSCKELEKNARQAIQSKEKDIDVEKVEDVNEIVTYGVTSTPALAIDGEVKISGKIVKPEEIEALL